MRNKRLVSLLTAFFMVMSLFAVPTMSYGKSKTKKQKYSIEMQKSVYTMKKGKTVKLKITKNKAAKKKKIVWSSSNKKVATVTAKGKVKAKKKGKTIITAKIKGTKIKTKCRLTVGTPVKKVKLNQTSVTLKRGESYILKATLSPKKPSNKKITYKSSDKSIVSVSSKGIITALQAGTAKVTATAADGTGKKAVCMVTVTNEVITPKPPEIPETPEPPDEEDDKNAEIQTREDWLVALVDLLGTNAAPYQEYSFDDFTEADAPDKLELAIQLGYVKLEPTWSSRVYLDPDSPITREFAAYTAIHALMYELSDQGWPAWDDRDELIYPEEDQAAVSLGIITLKGNRFLPENEMSVMETAQAIDAVKRVVASTQIDTGGSDMIQYVEGVTGTALEYELNETMQEIYTTEHAKTEGMQIGDIHILESADPSQKSVAVRITELSEEDGRTVISYEEPALEEVVEAFDVEGVEASAGIFTPAEGVSITDLDTGSSDLPSTQADADGSIELWGKKGISLKIDDVTVSGTLDLQNLEYRFIANPSWSLVTIEEVYLAINSQAELSLAYETKWDPDDDSIFQNEYKIADFNCPLPAGFNASGEIKLVLSAEGGFEVSYEIDATAGIQYTKNVGLRPVSDVQSQLNPVSLQGTAKGGIAIEPGAEWLGIDLVAVGAEVGGAIDGKMTNVVMNPFQVCIDSTAYLYLTIYARIGWEELELELNREIFNADNSILRLPMHFEESGKVNICTRETKKYAFKVKTLYEYRNTLGPFWHDSLEQYYNCEVDINIPQISAETPGAEIINAEIAASTEGYKAVYDEIRRNDFSRIKNGNLALMYVTYNVYSYNGTSVLVTESGACPYCSDWSPYRRSYYYNNRTGEIIDYVTYAQIHGYTIDEILQAYFSTETGRYFEDFIDESYLGTEVIFYFDKKGNLGFYDYVPL